MAGDLVTIKELLERLVIIETKCSIKMERDEKTAKGFTYWAIVITIMEVINVCVHTLLFWMVEK